MTDLTDIKDIKDICQQIVDVYKAKMEQADYNKQGKLYNFTWVAEMQGSYFQIYFNLPDYWEYAEFGTRGTETGLPSRKMPPIGPILKWIQYKRLIPRPGRNGKIPTTQQLAFAVSKHIQKYGTEGKYLLQETIDDTYDTLVDQLVDAITNELTKEIEKELEKDIEETI